MVQAGVLPTGHTAPSGVLPTGLTALPRVLPPGQTAPLRVLPAGQVVQQTHFRPRDTYRLKVRGWKKIFHANGNQKKDGVAILISDKIDFKIKTITRDKEGHYIMIKGSIQEEDITIVNIYAPNRSTSIPKANANSHKRGNQQ